MTSDSIVFDERQPLDATKVRGEPFDDQRHAWHAAHALGAHDEHLTQRQTQRQIEFDERRVRSSGVSSAVQDHGAQPESDRSLLNEVVVRRENRLKPRNERRQFGTRRKVLVRSCPGDPGYVLRPQGLRMRIFQQDAPEPIDESTVRRR